MIVLALVVLPTAAYVGGYYCLPIASAMGEENGKLIVERDYRYKWQADLFAPAGRLEEYLTGARVEIFCVDDLKPI